MARYRQPTHKKSMIGEAWQQVKWMKNKVGDNRKYVIFNTKYKVVTKNIEVDLETGYYKKEEKNCSDEKLIEKIFEKHEIKNQATIIYTDGSRRKSSRSTGASLVIEEQEIAYKISMNKLYSSYTAEAFAIKAALELMEKEAEERPNTIVILTDSKSTLQAIKNNHLNVYKNKYVIEIRRRHFTLEEEHNKRIIYIYMDTGT